MEKWCNVTDRSEIRPRATVSATNLQETGAGLNSVLGSDSSAPNRLNHGTDRHATASIIYRCLKRSQCRVFRAVSKNEGNAIT